MTCHCSTTPDCSYYEKTNKKLFKTLIEIEVGNWVRLFQCSECNSYWAIDELDKYVQRYVIRIKDRNNWQQNDYIREKKNLLLQSRGGTEEVECMWKNCHNKRVKGVAFCIDHLYDEMHATK